MNEEREQRGNLAESAIHVNASTVAVAAMGGSGGEEDVVAEMEPAEVEEGLRTAEGNAAGFWELHLRG